MRKISKDIDLHKLFKPDLTPKQMLRLGVFGGAYFIFAKNLKPKFIPADWWKGVKLSEEKDKKTGEPKKLASLNFFGVNASTPYEYWQKKGWINKRDPHGWFEWYCKYYQGRRLGKEDEGQIKRWLAMRRHIAQIAKHCRVGDLSCHTKQRQALLHWAYDSRKM